MGKYPATVLGLVFAVWLQLYHLNVAADEKLSKYLWTQTEDYHEAALQSTFIQGLAEVSLDPTGFGVYSVQDAIYYYRAKGSIDHALSMTTDPDLKKFLKGRSASYKGLYEEAFKVWHIQDPEGINLDSACENYVNHLDNVAKTMDPIYLVAAMIPCVKLWSWLGEQIDDKSEKFGVYNKWVALNLNSSYPGYEKYDKEIDNAFVNEKITKEKALGVYRESMKAEVDFFNSISPESYRQTHDEF